MSRESRRSWSRHLESETWEVSASAGGDAEALVPGLTVLWHADVTRVGERLALPELVSGREVELSRTAPCFGRAGSGERRPLADPYLSRRPLVLRPAADGAVEIDAGRQRGAVTVGAEELRGRLELPSAALDAGVPVVLAGRVALLLHRLSTLPAEEVPRFGLVGENLAFVEAIEELTRVAQSDLPVLIRGETGTGKELIARGLHQASPRRNKPYLAVNVGAIPAELAAAELFGAERGAFTGAERPRAGYFRRAHRGTLFLDEVGEMPGELQVLLLRALESGEVQPLGAVEPERVDVRIIAATDADLEARLQSGGFRAPLLHRLNGFEIRLPPLRSRPDDLGRLLVHFLRQELEARPSRRLGDEGPTAEPWLPAPLVARLTEERWPGNVRQLANLVRKLVVAYGDAATVPLSAGDRFLTAAAGAPPEGPDDWQHGRPSARRRGVYRSAAEVSEAELLTVLRAHRFALQPTAAQLGISRTALYGLLERSSRVRKAGDLSREEIARASARCDGDVRAMAEVLEVSGRGLRRRMTELGL